MDWILIPIWLALIVFVLGGPVAAWVALLRTRRLSDLERRLERLEHVVARSVIRPAPAPEEAPAASSPAVATPSEAVPSDASSATPADLPSSAGVPPSVDASAEVEASEPAPAWRDRLSVLRELDWERWVGVQGAALLGGIVLALAGIFLFRWSVEHGLISPAIRVAAGIAVGLGCVVGSELRWRERYASVANAVAGGGIVVLYAALWAAGKLYGLVGLGPAFGAMTLVTATCCLLAVRRGSPVIAVLGLVGGFATPLLLASGSDRPLGFFTYVLVLDVAFVEVARRRQWPLLVPLGLVVTLAFQALWVVGRMGADRLPLGLGVLATFAIFFVVASQLVPAGRERSRALVLSRAGAVLAPFALVFWVALQADLGPHLYPIGLLLGVLALAVAWLPEDAERETLSMAAAGGVVAVFGAWLGSQPLTSALVVEGSLVAVALAGVFHLVDERRPAEGFTGGALPAAIAASGLLAFVAVGTVLAGGVSIFPWTIALVGLAGLLARQATRIGRERLHLVGAVGVTVALSLHHLEYGHWTSPEATLLVLLAFAVAFQALALVVREGKSRVAAEQAAGTVAVGLLVALAPSRVLAIAAPVAVHVATALLALLAALVAARLRAGGWLLAGVVAGAFAQSCWTWEAPMAGEPRTALLMMLAQLLTLTVLAAWPALLRRSFVADRHAWRAAALAGPLWFLSLLELFGRAFGDAWIGAVPLVLALVAALVAAAARPIWETASPVRRSALAWMLGSALVLVAVAIPLQLEREWVTLGWALQGAALVTLWARLDHPGLKALGAALLLGATVRLVANPEVLGYHPRSGVAVLNWMLTTYLVPAAALVWSARTLAPLEVVRARVFEAQLYARGVPIVAGGAGLAAVLVVFVWLNLAVADAFAEGPRFTLAFERLPARDLTLSLVWGAYALVLLAIGVARRISALRSVSLAVLVLTIGKVFLHDLGQLTDLYRVASLVGLALSLIAVSLGYQRFVFRRAPDGRDGKDAPDA